MLLGHWHFGIWAGYSVIKTFSYGDNIMDKGIGSEIMLSWFTSLVYIKSAVWSCADFMKKTKFKSIKTKKKV